MTRTVRSTTRATTTVMTMTTTTMTMIRTTVRHFSQEESDAICQKLDVMDAAKANATNKTFPEFITEGLQPIYRGVLCNN